jgi:uncharacterized protein YdhG (YjbR/CyaY superfamily)
MTTQGLPQGLSAPALRALESVKARTLKDLSTFTEADIAGLHGIGPSALRLLRGEMAKLGLAFKGEKAPGSSAIDAYIESQPEPQRGLLLELREIIRKAAPEASEKISYQMPTFYFNGNLVHFAGFKAHIGLYPGSGGVAAFESRLGAYEHSKGAIQLPLDKALPAKLISEIVAFRLRENRDKGSSGRSRPARSD